MANVTDTLLQRIAIEGDQAVIQSLNRVASAGETAFKRLSQSAQNFNQASQGAEQRMARIEQAAGQFGHALGGTAMALGSFSSRLMTIGKVAGGFLATIAAVGRGVSIMQRRIMDSYAEEREVIRSRAYEERRSAELVRTQIREREDLARQYTITADNIHEYSKALRELSYRQERERQDMLAQSAAAEEAARRAGRAQAEMQRRLVTMRLEEFVGPQVTSALLNLGSAIESVEKQLIAAFGPTAASFLNSFAQTIRDNSSEVVAFVQNIAKELQPAITAISTQLNSLSQIMVKGFTGAVNVLIGTLVPAFQALSVVVTPLAYTLNAMFGTTFTGQTLVATAIILQFVGAFRALASILPLVVSLFNLLKATMGPWGALLTVIVGLIVTQLIPYLKQIDWAAMAAAAMAAWTSVENAIRSAIDTMKNAWNDFKGFFNGLIQDLIARVNSFIERVKAAAAAIRSLFSSGGGGGGGGEGFARGGRIRGAGTSTSDSIPIWASTGEWVIRASAAKYYGNRIMSAINSMSIPKSAFSFNAGGLVDALAIPSPRGLRFASGGEITGSASRPINLTIDGQTFDGLMTDESTAERLIRYARKKNIQSAGRRPDWFGGRK